MFTYYLRSSKVTAFLMVKAKTLTFFGCYSGHFSPIFSRFLQISALNIQYLWIIWDLTIHCGGRMYSDPVLK